MADAKPVWSALYQSLTSVDTEHYGYRRSSIYEMSTRCIGLRMRGKLLKVCDLVAREGVEPPTPAFSELAFPVFPTTSMEPGKLPNSGKYEKSARTVGDFRG